MIGPNRLEILKTVLECGTICDTGRACRTGQITWNMLSERRVGYHIVTWTVQNKKCLERAEYLALKTMLLVINFDKKSNKQHRYKMRVLLKQRFKTLQISQLNLT